MEIKENIAGKNHQRYELRTSLISYDSSRKILRHCSVDIQEHYEVPDFVEEIGIEAFVGCKKLRTVVIPSSVKLINFYAFANCINLKTINILSSDITIRFGAFENCENLTSIILKNKNLKRIEVDDDTFKSIENKCKLYVPKGEVDKVKSFNLCCESVLLQDVV